MTRCAVRGLHRGDCPDYSRRDDGLCYYHGKLEDGLTAPPGDYVDNDEFPSTANLARASYEGSTHPHFGVLVDFGERSLVGTGGRHARMAAAAAA